MSASSAARLPRKLRCTYSEAARTLLALVLVVVALSVVGMHQMSLGHAFADPRAGAFGRLNAAYPAAADQTGSGGPAGGGMHTDTPGPLVGSPDGTFVNVAAGTSGNSSGTEHGCPGCPNHGMGFSACLLALTLLVLRWWLAPPRVRQLPRRLLLRPVRISAVVGRRVPAFSLAELSVLRT